MANAKTQQTVAVADVATENNKDVLSQLVEALNNRGKAGKPKDKQFAHIDAQIAYGGSAIVLPDDPRRMQLPEAVEWLQRVQKLEEEEIAVHEQIDSFPFDGAIAFMKAMQRTFGWAEPLPPKGFFDQPPTTVSVPIDVHERVQIIWGKFAMPGIEGHLATGVTRQGERWVFVIQGKVKKKYVAAVAALANLTREIVAKESIYRGKPIQLNTNEDGHIDFHEPPVFLDTASVREEELIFSEELEEQVRTNLFTPIIKSAACRRHGVPLKRSVLAEGPFGTGKTLLAFVTAKKARDHGWTFIMVSTPQALSEALIFAAMYQPAVVFCEDIDRALGGEERTEQIDAILNTIDGLISKGKEIIAVLTSNEAEHINRAMLRPGRLDAVLSIQAPDAVAAERLMRLYGRGLIHPEEKLTTAGQELNGQIPAVIRECVERAKLRAISRLEREDDPIVLIDRDVTHAAREMKRHLELLRGPLPDPESLEQKVGRHIGELVRGAVTGNGEWREVTKQIEELHRHIV